MRNNTVRKMAVNAMVAALYFVLSLPFMTFIFGPVQLRVSEAFTLLPVFSSTPIAGLTLGCVLVNTLGVFTKANILGPLDVLFGSAATLLAAFFTHQLRGVLCIFFPKIDGKTGGAADTQQQRNRQTNSRQGVGYIGG